MSHTKKILFSLFVLFFPLSVLASDSRGISISPDAFSGVYEGESYEYCFSDLNDYSPYREAAEYLCYNDIIGGYPDGTFRPENSVNRAELAKFLSLARFGRTEVEEENVSLFEGLFPDVASDTWYEQYVLFTAKKSIITGYADGNFRPGNTVTRAEFLTMLVRAFDADVDLSYPYTDIESGSWYAPYIGISYERNMISALENKLLPHENMNRGEIAYAIWQFLKYEDLENNTDTENEDDDDVPNEEGDDESQEEQENEETTDESGEDETEEADEEETETTEDIVLEPGKFFFVLDEAITPEASIFGYIGPATVATYKLEAIGEDVNVEELTVQFFEVDTTSTLRVDPKNDTDAITKIALYNSLTNEPIRRKDGPAAESTEVGNNGQVHFENLNLPVADGDFLFLDVRVAVHPLHLENDAESGHTFAVSMLLDTASGKTKVVGASTEMEYGDEEIFTDDETNEMTAVSNYMYVFANSFFPTFADHGPGPYEIGEATSLFFITFPGSYQSDNNRALLHEITIELDGTGICVSKDEDCSTQDGYVYLLNQFDNIIAATPYTGGNSYTLTVGELNGATIDDEPVTITRRLFEADGKQYYEMDSNNLKYEFRADLYHENNYSLTATIRINGPQPGNDDVIWRDGEEGIDVQWISVPSEEFKNDQTKPRDRIEKTFEYSSE